MMKILLIEDERVISDSIKEILMDSYTVDQAFDGEVGLFKAEDKVYDLIVLDIMMPKMDGYTVLKKLRDRGIHTPVLILSARGAIDDKVEGFNRGADDYLVKPFDRTELLLRINALLRRSGALINVSRELVLADLVLNLDSHSLTKGDTVLNLSGKAFEIMEYLMNNQDQIITKEQIFSRVWGFDSDTILTVVEVYMSGIRKELKRVDCDAYLKTVRGLGYLLSGQVS